MKGDGWGMGELQGENWTGSMGTVYVKEMVKQGKSG